MFQFSEINDISVLPIIVRFCCYVKKHSLLIIDISKWWYVRLPFVIFIAFGLLVSSFKDIFTDKYHLFFCFYITLRYVVIHDIITGVLKRWHAGQLQSWKILQSCTSWGKRAPQFLGFDHPTSVFCTLLNINMWDFACLALCSNQHFSLTVIEH